MTTMTIMMQIEDLQDIKVQVADDEVIIVLSNLMPNGKQVGTEMAGIIKKGKSSNSSGPK